jgi:hypothetical protein
MHSLTASQLEEVPYLVGRSLAARCDRYSVYAHSYYDHPDVCYHSLSLVDDFDCCFCLPPHNDRLAAFARCLFVRCLFDPRPDLYFDYKTILDPCYDPRHRLFETAAEHKV